MTNTTLSIPEHRDRGRRISVNLRSPWSLQRVPGQGGGLHSKALTKQNNNETKTERERKEGRQGRRAGERERKEKKKETLKRVRLG